MAKLLSDGIIPVLKEKSIAKVIIDTDITNKVITLSPGFSIVYGNSSITILNNLVIANILVEKTTGTFVREQDTIGYLHSEYIPTWTINTSCGLSTDKYTTPYIGYMYVGPDSRIIVEDWNNNGCRYAKISAVWATN